MSEKIDRRAIVAGLTRGLLAGYCGETSFEETERGSFKFKTTRIDDIDYEYDDHWLDSSCGGGQEIVRINGIGYTRFYIGGVLPHNELEELGTTEKSIIGFLKETILEKKDTTRLFEPCQRSHEEWSYRYELIGDIGWIPLTIAKETILFKGRDVFAHVFVLCPIA